MKILNFGSLNIDKVYRVPHFVRPGETISSECYQCFPGGKGLNQSIAVARAGQKICHAGTVGKDGHFLVRILQESGVDTCYVRESGSVTGHALIQVSDAGENCIILFQGSNYENEKEFMDEVLGDYGAQDILMLQNEINGLEYLLERGKEKGLQILLNPSPMDEALKRMDLSGVSWLMLNETEGCELTGEIKSERIADVLLGRYPDMKIILTLGGEGALYLDRNRMFRQPCFRVKTVDTTAAGDTFTGYYVAAMVEGMGPEEALRLAAAAAGLAVSREGASVSIPRRAEVERILQR